ncbi:hypothetical protein BH09PAT2_BH09PAT2_01600 [soil metagenome]
MKADIYIPTANNTRALTECLDSLQTQTYKDFSVILVGIKKNKNISELIKKYTDLDINYLVQSAPGLVQAAQDAFNISTSDVFIRIDDDVVTQPDWLQNIINIFSKESDVGGVTGPTLTSQEGRKSRDLFLFFEKTRKSSNLFWKLVNKIYIQYIYENRLYDIGHFMRSGAFTLGSNFETSLTLKQPIEVDNLEACNMAIRSSLLKQFGGFDLIFNRGLGEYHEADIAYKIKKAGYKVIFSSKVRLQHKVETTETASKPRADAFHRISNFIIFYKRHIGIRNPDYLARFLTNVCFQNAYYGYKFLTTGDWHQLGALAGTIYGLLKPA